MRGSRNFDLAGALSEVLSGFSISVVDRGELLVVAFFTWLRDIVKGAALLCVNRQSGFDAVLSASVGQHYLRQEE
jgi:hypothetical protein